MSTKKIPGKFYPLQHQELLKLNRILTRSELVAYLWLKTKYPFGGKLIETNTQRIAEDLEISRRSVQRALVKLQQEGLVEPVISQFYRFKSKSAPQSENNFEVKDNLQVAIPLSPDVVSETSSSLQRHQGCSDDGKIVETALSSPPSSQSKIEQGFKTPKISKTYIDFKKILSEDESENFFRFVKKATENFQQPIQDLEAWLASKTKAGQDRWIVYYQKYQLSKKTRKPESKCNPISESDKQNAIANYQKQLNQEQNSYQKTSHEISTSEFNRLLDNPDNQIKRIDKLENKSKLISKPFGKHVSEGCEHLPNLSTSSIFSNESIQGGMQ